MPTIVISGQRIHVEDSFLKLSPEEQDRTVDEIAQSLPKAGQEAPTGASVRNAPEAADQVSEKPQETGENKGLPSPPQQPEYDGSGASLGSFANALGNSVFRGLPAAIENGASVIGRTIAPNAGKPVWDALQNRASENREAQAQSYQHPKGVDPSVARELSWGNMKGALLSLGYSGAESAGPLAAVMAASAIPYVGLPAAAAIGATEAADNVSQEKKAAGLTDSGRLTGTDTANVMAQGALNAIPLTRAGAPLIRGGLNTLEEGARGAVGSLMDQGSLSYQGGDVGGLSDVARNAADAGLTRGVVKGAPMAVKGGLNGAQMAAESANMLRNRYATDFGRGLAEYKAGVEAGTPLAQMSDRAKDAVATLDYGHSLADRAAAEVGNSTGATTANGALGASKIQLENIRDYLKANPQANGIKAQPKILDRAFNEAIREAQNHNVSIAPETEGNAAPSAQQRLASMLPADIWRPIEARLNTMDRMSQDRLQKRTKPVAGPVLRSVAGTLIPAALGEVGLHELGMGGGALGLALGSGIASATHRGTNSILDRVGARVDSALGLGTPPGQRFMGQKLALANQMGVQPRAVGEQLNDIEEAARAAAIDNARVRQQRAQQAAPPSGSPRGNTGMGPTSPGPSGPPPSAPSAPSPRTAQAVPPRPQPMPGGAMPNGNAPMAHTAAEIMQQRVPGWAAATSERYGVTPTEIMSYLSNRLADGRLKPEDYSYLTSTDNIGENLGGMQREIGAIRHAGLWGKVSAFRDPQADQTLQGLHTDVDRTQGAKPRSGQTTPRQGDVDYEGNPIRNRASYQATINQASTIARAIISSHPHLLGAVAAIQKAKTPALRLQAMREQIGKLPEYQRGEALVTLSPLTSYGYKGSKKVDG